jgi:hypothetical protein
MGDDKTAADVDQREELEPLREQVCTLFRIRAAPGRDDGRPAGHRFGRRLRPRGVKRAPLSQ